jgi:hypothetical protein
MNAKEAKTLSLQSTSELTTKINDWYQGEKSKADALLTALLTAPVMDDVRLIVTEFIDVLSANGSTIPQTKYKLEINGELQNPSEHSFYRLLHIERGVPRIVRLTIGAEPVFKGEGADKRVVSVDQYIPVGVVFFPKPDDDSGFASIARRDFKDVAGYCFGKELFFVFSADFDSEDLDRYAVVIQRLRDAKVGIIDPSVKNGC